jgi:hypothetical protein
VALGLNAACIFDKYVELKFSVVTITNVYRDAYTLEIT